MTKSAHTATRELAAGLRRQAVRAGTSTPAVRGASWHRAVVDTVGAGGTVTTTDGIVALRAEAYQAPASGDIIRVSISASGAAVAEGRYVGGGPPARQSGTTLMSWSSATTAQKVVTFPVAFATSPLVFININTGDGSVGRWSCRAYTISSTQFTAFLYAPATTATTGSNVPVQWLAVAPDS